jgi:hypothetical protein
MSKRAAGGSYGRFWLNSRRSAAILAGLGVVGSVYYWVHQRPVQQTPPSRTTQSPTPAADALKLLSNLRARFESSQPQAQEESSNESEPSSPLLPGLADKFEKQATGYFPHFAASLGQADAHVVIPARANALFELADIGTGAKIEAKLDDVRETAAQVADGYAVYPQAHASGATLLRRAMPNGSEDFLSFDEAPTDPRISYSVNLDQGVAGLRLVSNTLEFLDKDSTPRLRVAPPYIVSSDGHWLEAKLDIEGCVVNQTPSAPWQQPQSPPGATSCKLRVTWDGDDVIYPAILDPTWMTTGSMASARQGHTATVLSTSKVLVTGGTNGSTTFATAELYDRTTGTWAATGSMTGARQLHTAVQLGTSGNPTTSGKVLVAGGKNGSTSLNTAQLYSPTTGTWVAASNLNAARHQHTATVLPSGKVLVTGGLNGTTTLSTAATYDPSTDGGVWAATTGPLPSAVKSHTATLLTTSNQQLNNKVLLCGGNNGTSTSAFVYLYDPVQNAFSTLDNMPGAREGHTATLLANGKLLLTGGKNGSPTLNSTVIYDPGFGPGSWSTDGTMTAARQQHTASLLSNGQVLVAGGNNGSSSLASAELYNGTSWSATTAMPAAVQAHTASTLASGIILIAGGVNGTTTVNAARLYDVTGGNTCTSGSQCQSGNCVSGVCCNTACTDQCYSCSLSGLVGICSPKTNGTACNDGNLCTQTDTCQSGTCTGANPVACTALDQCHGVGACNQSTGTCSNPNKADGTNCNDGNLCTQTDTCQSGTCTGANPVVCTALDQCHAAGICNPSTGVCSNPSVADGTACSDGNSCTLSDTCQSGTCTSGSPRTCTASDACHLVGTCNPSDGSCSDPVALDGTLCTDNNACTGPDQCASGTCQSGSVVPVDDGDPCTLDSCDILLGVKHVPNTSNPNCAKWYSGGLKLEVLTNSCSTNQVQQSVQVTNTGGSPVTLSDIAIKFWVNDTSGSAIAPQISAGGCSTTASTYPNCYHQVQGTSATAVRITPACGPDPDHQAGWEVTVSNTDGAQLQLGDIWTNLQVALHLANAGNFSPGTNTWYSPCLTSDQYAADNHFAIYYKGNLAFSSGICAPDCRAPHGAQRLSGHLRPSLTAAPLVGPVPASTKIQVSVGLPLGTAEHSEQELKDFVQQVSDPSSPKYRQYLTPEVLAATYGPTQASHDGVSAWAQDNSLTVAHAYRNRLMTTVTGTAASIEQALFVNLNYYSRPDGTYFYAIDREPSLDLSASTTTVEHIGGLDNYFVPNPKWGFGDGTLHAGDLRVRYVQNSSDPACPTDITKWNGAGQCIGIVAFYTTYDPNDIAAFASSNALGTPSVIPVSVNNFDISQSALGDMSTVEVESDIEMALSIAPRAAIRVYESNYVSSNDTASVLNAMASDTIRCNQLSMSWGYSTSPTLVHIVSEILPAQGQSFFTATGDWGAYPTNPIDRAEDYVGDEANFITWVGGTKLTKPTSSTYSEIAWPLGGGGVFDGPLDSYGRVSRLVPIPDYQRGLGNGASPNNRNVPDVSTDANDDATSAMTVYLTSPDTTKIGAPNYGTHDSTYTCSPGKRTGVAHVGGTSISTPMWAGFTAIANEVSASNGLPPVGFLNPALYSIGRSNAYSASFHDVGGDGQTSGLDTFTGVWAGCRNGPYTSAYDFTDTGNGYKYTAQPGYDLATGLGTPRCGLIKQLSSGSLTANSAVSAGGNHTCVVRSNGSVSCWGDNSHGQLGVGTNAANALLPVRVSSLSNAVAIAAGFAHTCAVLSDGTVWCWGQNQSGQLGNGTTTDAFAPVRVSGLANIQMVTAGYNHTCAGWTSGEGQVACWGDNSFGQLGDGTTVSSSVPVNGPLSVYSISAGKDFTCASIVHGPDSSYVWCWGANCLGQLGTGIDSTEPGSNSTCSTDPCTTQCTNGPCWGYMPSGYAVYGLDYPWTYRVTSGGTHSCVLEQQSGQWQIGTVRCWGGDLDGELGKLLFEHGCSNWPLDAVDLPYVYAFSVSAGNQFTCAVSPNAAPQGPYYPISAWCWGDNTKGQLAADPASTPSSVIPLQVQGLGNVSAVSAGLGQHACALLENGNIVCWGSNSSGQLGNGSTVDRYVPSTVYFFEW